MSVAESEISSVVDRLFREHNRSLLRFLVTRLRSVQEANDVAQESYIRLLQLQQPGAVNLLRAYLFKTAANLAIDRLRRGAVRDRTSTESLDDLSDYPTLERVVMALQELDIVQEVVASLPLKTREAFLQHVIDGVPTQEVARRMGLKERMVREHVSRALAQCKRSVSRAGGKIALPRRAAPLPTFTAGASYTWGSTERTQCQFIR
jgi:RNA polymerase sigma-70 factor (ECF subfamily)